MCINLKVGESWNQFSGFQNQLKILKYKVNLDYDQHLKKTREYNRKHLSATHTVKVTLFSYT